jgi:hypothetical protein
MKYTFFTDLLHLLENHSKIVCKKEKKEDTNIEEEEQLHCFIPF